MLDHLFLAAVEQLRRSCDDAMLDGKAGEERLASDLLGGDLSWEGAYALPGEGRPHRVRADLTLDWPTWSQTSFRAWQLDGDMDEPPEINVEVVMRVQFLAEPPELATIRSVLPDEGPSLGGEHLRRATPTIEQLFDSDLHITDWAVEFAYEGTYEVTTAVAEDPTLLGDVFDGVGPWIASALVRLGDLKLAYRPPEELEDDGR
jgi:hypothetical protein